jgi:hypothetical protein
MATAEEITVRTYRELIVGLDARRKALGLQMLAVDFEAKMQDGYASKIFCGVRNLGPMSFGAQLIPQRGELP